jgi:DNA-binding GntR family transcriptional regulator
LQRRNLRKEINGMAKVTSVQVVQALRARILSGALPGGLQLKQEQLAQEFGVSRIPVREALKSLEAEGLVRHELYKGAVVASSSVDEMIEMLDIRIALEIRALRLAFPRYTPALLDEAQAILTKYDAAESPREWSDFNIQFHLALYRPANKPRLLQMIENLTRGTDRQVHLHISRTVGREHPQSEHFALLEACRRGEMEKALDLLESHIAGTQAALLRAGNGVGQGAA